MIVKIQPANGETPVGIKMYYDPEYDREVDENYIKHQYDWFSQQNWFNKTYEQFREENFREMKEDVPNQKAEQNTPDVSAVSAENQQESVTDHRFRRGR